MGDLADVQAAISPTPMLLEDSIDAKNRLIPERELRSQLQPLYDAYRNVSTNLSVRSGQDGSHVSEWLLSHLAPAGR